MIVNNRYKIYWEHNNEGAKVYLSNEELTDKLVEIVDKSTSRENTKEKIFELMKTRKSFRRSFSKCFIEDLEKETKFEGLAIVHPNDTFDKKKGMYISLKDAIINIKSYGERLLIWKEYFKQCKPKIDTKRIDDAIAIINSRKNNGEDKNKYSLG